jgi:hypothetical protein
MADQGRDGGEAGLRPVKAVSDVEGLVLMMLRCAAGWGKW